jgi:16S rRNA (guanine(966)-N(2))-methyltransferase RsmD
LDLYAGTGAVGIEALSRGALHVTCIESNAEALHLLHQNVSDCKMTHHITVHAQTVKQFLGRPDQWGGPYDLVFADPPYAIAQELESLFDNVAIDHLFAADSWLVVEHADKTTLPTHLGRSTFLRRYHYGDTALTIFSFSRAAQP